MTCTQHDLSDNIQDGLDIKSCYKCDGKGYTKLNKYLTMSKLGFSQGSSGRFCEPCNGSGFGENVKKPADGSQVT
mgnify:CR=1 FL=1